MCAKSFVHRGCLPPASSNTLMIHMLMSIILPQAAEVILIPHIHFDLLVSYILSCFPALTSLIFTSVVRLHGDCSTDVRKKKANRFTLTQNVQAK